MLTYKIEYKDFFSDDKETATVYLNLTQDEMYLFMKNNLLYMAKGLQRVVEEEDILEGYSFFRDLVLMSYGVRTDDGRFEKNDKHTTHFVQSPKFDALMEKILGDPKEVERFMNGIIPVNLRKAIQDRIEKENKES